MWAERRRSGRGVGGARAGREEDALQKLLEKERDLSGCLAATTVQLNTTSNTTESMQKKR